MTEKIQLKNNKVLEIILDENPINPREDDNLTTMICSHKRYILGDKHDYNTDNYNNWDEFENAIRIKEKPVIMLPLYMYDHSGITISTTPFGCRWDSGQIGFVIITHKSIDALGCFINDGESFTDYNERLIKYLIAEVELYDMYLTGETYGFRIVDDEGNELDSCWGFYGSDWETNGILDHIKKEDIPENILRS